MLQLFEALYLLFHQLEDRLEEFPLIHCVDLFLLLQDKERKREQPLQ